MLAAGWVGFGAGCLPPMRGFPERLLLAAYGVVSALRLRTAHQLLVLALRGVDDDLLVRAGTRDRRQPAPVHPLRPDHLHGLRSHPSRDVRRLDPRARPACPGGAAACLTAGRLRTTDRLRRGAVPDEWTMTSEDRLAPAVRHRDRLCPRPRRGPARRQFRMRLSRTGTVRADRLGDGAAHRRFAQRARRSTPRSAPRGGGGVHLHAGRRADPGHRSRSDPGAGPLPGLRRAVGRRGGGARRHRVSRAGGLARPGPARRGDRVHRDGGGGDGYQRHARRR